MSWCRRLYLQVTLSTFHCCLAGGPNPFINKTDMSFAVRATNGTAPQLDFTLINSHFPVVRFYCPLVLQGVGLFINLLGQP